MSAMLYSYPRPLRPRGQRAGQLWCRRSCGRTKGQDRGEKRGSGPGDADPGRLAFQHLSPCSVIAVSSLPWMWRDLDWLCGKGLNNTTARSTTRLEACVAGAAAASPSIAGRPCRLSGSLTVRWKPRLSRWLSGASECVSGNHVQSIHVVPFRGVFHLVTLPSYRVSTTESALSRHLT